MRGPDGERARHQQQQHHGHPRHPHQAPQFRGNPVLQTIRQNSPQLSPIQSRAQPPMMPQYGAYPPPPQVVVAVSTEGVHFHDEFSFIMCEISIYNLYHPDASNDEPGNDAESTALWSTATTTATTSATTTISTAASSTTKTVA